MKRLIDWIVSLFFGKVNDMKIGDKVSFTYLKGGDSGLVGGILTKDYASKAENYKGRIVDIRDIEKHPISNESARNCIERSKNLVTVRLKDGFHQSFYDGRMVNARLKRRGL